MLLLLFVVVVVVVESLTIKRCIVRFLYYVLLTPQKDGGEITR